ncbi:MAG: type I pullulanase, partial [Fimbriimonadaceae bacterium]|nr:type I pullulanase [Fimbriimonadaceae bacterium]
RPDSLAARLRIEGAASAIRVAGVDPAGPARVFSTPDPQKRVLAGTIQGALGGSDWSPDDDLTKMRQTAPGVWELFAVLPEGEFEYKLAIGGGWDENYGAGFVRGGGNIRIRVPRNGTLVRFIADFNAQTLRDSLNDPAMEMPNQVPPGAAGRVDRSRGPFQEFHVRLSRPVTDREFIRGLRLTGAGASARPVVARDILDAPRFFYDKPDLGPTWSPTGTWFKVWSPAARATQILLERHGRPMETLNMRRGSAGVWYHRVPGNLDGARYRYRFDTATGIRTAPDIHAKAAEADGVRSIVLDMRRTNPADWPAPRPWFSGRQTDAVVYEFHIRDFTVDPSSGVRPDWRGKYLGLVQPGTRSPGGRPTGLDSLKALGVTHVHLLPFHTFNPANSKVYNWGYETNLFNVPEEQYATDPDDPIKVIRETKQMVAGLHRAGIRVIQDVVYNHSVPGWGPDSAYWQTSPYHFFRTDARGRVMNESGVGNALADERPMIRRYIRDSLVFWLREYRLDGYRFDLLGMHVPESMDDWQNAIRDELPSAVIYGEPWTGGGPLRFAKGAQRGMRVAVFNDRFRGAGRGELDGPGGAFLTGHGTDVEALKQAMSGFHESGPNGFTASPEETINYVSAHDNLSWLDKFTLSRPEADREMQKRNLKLAGAFVLLSQGVPFIEGGVQLGRTKGGNSNSYNAGDAVNRYDWARGDEFETVRAWHQGLIELRRARPEFRLPAASPVRAHLRFLPQMDRDLIAFTLEEVTPGAGRLLVLMNGRMTARTVDLPAGEWTVLADGTRAGTRRLGTRQTSLPLGPFEAWVLRQTKTP